MMGREEYEEGKERLMIQNIAYHLSDTVKAVLLCGITCCMGANGTR